MAELLLKDVRNHILQPIGLAVDEGSLFVVVGPSGAGKTSLLRVIAGLADHQGRIWLDGREITSLPAHKRSVGYVSQDLYLFPHQTLEGNLRTAMSRLGWDRYRQTARQAELVGMLRIKHLIGRRPDTFSGGEKQRAALARALASNPRLLLLDEPFSKLDFRTARYLRAEFKSLQRKLGLTTMVVTHNIEEARYLADRLAVMSAGGLCLPSASGGTGSKGMDDIETFLETPNLLDCRFMGVPSPGLAEVLWGDVRLLAPDIGRAFKQVSVRRWDIELGQAPPAGPPVNRFKGLVSAVEVNDDSARIVCTVSASRLYVETTPQKWRDSNLAVGQSAHILLRLQALEPI